MIALTTENGKVFCLGYNENGRDEGVGPESLFYSRPSREPALALSRGGSGDLVHGYTIIEDHRL